jgi:hypothetical protein
VADGAKEGVEDGAKRVVARRIGAGVVGLALVAAVALTVVAGAWGSTLREESRMLPGTLLAGVDVGAMTHEEAREQALDALAASLDTTVSLTHLDVTWSTTPRELGAGTDLDARLRAAGRSTDEATLPQLVRMRWAGADARPLEVGIEIPHDRLVAFVDDIGDELDLPPTDATLRWVDGAPETTDDAEGLHVDRDATVTRLVTALDAITGESTEAPPDGTNGADGAASVPVATEVLAPEVSTTTVTAAREAALRAIDAALDHAVTARHGDANWTVTPRELDAEPLGEPVVAAAMSAEPATLEVGLVIPDGPVDALVAEMAGALDLAPVHAGVSYRDGTLQTSTGRDGLSLDRPGARTALVAALHGDTEAVELELATARARTGDVGDVLLVRQGQRVVELHRGGDMIRSWPIAVGTGGSPTPTGTFTIGAKRFEPTWVNPALDRWGKDMPARIGPGPDNPLGARALNWNRPGGGDTLIRFHGTPNEASIGTASSNGCVRMFNTDVIELYDLVGSGTTILSVA